MTRVESLRDGVVEKAEGWSISRWREDVETDLLPEFAPDRGGVVYRKDRRRYLAAWPGAELLDQVITRMAREAQVAVTNLPEGLRLRRTDRHVIAFNYSGTAVNSAGIGSGAPIIGKTVIPPAGFAAWKRG